MARLVIIVQVLIFVSITFCCRPKASGEVVETQDSCSTNHSALTLSDSTIVYYDEEDTITYRQSELDSLKEAYPMLAAKIPLKPQDAYAAMLYSEPDDVYYCRFTSEARQDEFFLLYGYFLKQQNGEEKHQARRERLIKIYRTINHIYATLSYGGTYFGHQHLRIIGLAEYAIYLQHNNDYYAKDYSYKKLKEMYIQTFKEYVKGELSEDNLAFERNEKREREMELIQKLEELDSLISDYSDLKCAQTFQYSNY